MAFEKYIIPEQGIKKMPIHTFVAILSEYLEGMKTGTECKDAIETYLSATLTTEEAADITNTLAYIQGGADMAQKARRMTEVYRACVLAEAGIWYGTRAALRTRLTWSIPI